jgi:hypothetical protein
MYVLVIEHCLRFFVDYMMIIIEKTKLCPDTEVWMYFQDSQLNKCKDISKHDNSWINTDLNIFNHNHQLYKKENNLFIHSLFKIQS